MNITTYKKTKINKKTVKLGSATAMAVLIAACSDSENASNNAPAGALNIAGIVAEDNMLTVNSNLVDLDGLGDITYQWQRAGVNIGGATGNTYTLEQADVGEVINVVASYTDGLGTNESVTSVATSAVTNVNDNPVGTVVIAGTVNEGDTLTASNNLSDEDGLGAVAYQWQRGGDVIVGATGNTYTLEQADVGETITVVASYTDAQNTNESVTSGATDAVVNVNDAGQISIEGTAIAGQTLTANVIDEDGIAGAIAYQWLRDGNVIVGATDNTYTLVLADVGEAITVSASYNDGYGTAEAVVSGATDIIEGGPVASIALNLLDGTDGFRLDGDEENDSSGRSVSNAGDVNGDGYDDIIVGAYFADPNGKDAAGSSYVLFGKADGFATVDLSAPLNNETGFRIDGADVDDRSGYSVSAAGDVNGDGYADIIIGAYAADTDVKSNVGSSYVLFGKADGFATVDLADDLNNETGFRIDGAEQDDWSGFSVSAAGDVNGDGYDDIIIGAYKASLNGQINSGSSYVLFGKEDGFATVDLAEVLNNATGFRIDGEGFNDYSGFSVSAAGDVNGDGYADIIIGARRADPNFKSSSGSSYVLFGKEDGFATVDLAEVLNNATGFRIDGALISDNSGYSVSAAGDVNGDGYDDIIIGAPFADQNGNNNSGSSYVIFGKEDGFATVDLADALASDVGFRIDGAAEDDRSGRSVSAAGDVNGDGYDDVIIGANDAPNGDASGASYVVFGKADGFGTINLSDLDGNNGFRIDGVAGGDNSGRSVSAAGDINGDGYDDLIIGADGADPNGNDGSGSSYVVFGGAQFSSLAAAATLGDDNLLGLGTGDTLNGGAGNDIINAQGGDDILIGGVGTDTLNGGTGADKMWGGGNLDVFSFIMGDSSVAIGGVGDNGTITGYDTIFDFSVGNGTNNSETIDLTGTPSVVANGVVDGDDSELSINAETIKAHSVSDGIITFDDVDVFNTALNISGNASLAAVIQYLQNQDFGDAGATVAFDYGADTFVFSQGNDIGTDDFDILIKLEDAQVDNLITTNGTGEFDLFIA